MLVAMFIVCIIILLTSANIMIYIFHIYDFSMYNL